MPLADWRWIFCGPRGLRAGWRLLIYLVLFFFWVSALHRTLGRFLPSRPATPTTLQPSLLLGSEAILAAAALLAAVVMAFGERRRLADYGLPVKDFLRTCFWEGTLWGLAALSALLGALWLGGWYRFLIGAADGWRLLQAGLWWAVGFLLVGVFEEFLFRGYTLATLASGIGFWPAALLLSAAFGAIHLGNRGENWLGGALAGLIGLVFALMLRRTGSLWFPIGFHASWDWGQTFLFGVPNSGQVSAVHWLAASPQGPAWLSGGTVGPEGSVLAPVVVAVVAGLVHWRFRQTRFPPTPALEDVRGG